MARGAVWTRVDPADGLRRHWIDETQIAPRARGAWLRGIGPAPEGADPIPDRDPTTGERTTGRTHTPAPQIADVPRAVVGSRGAVVDYDPEKDRYRVKTPGRVGTNVDGSKAAALLRLVDGDAIAARLARLAPVYAVPERTAPDAEPDDSYQVHVALRDLHAGDGDRGERTRMLWRVMHETMRRAEAVCGRVAEVVLPCGSDLLTIDTWSRTTTKGTQLFPDVDAPEEVLDIALEWMVGCVDIARQYADRVRVVREPGNHDRLMSYGTAVALAAWYRATPSVDVVLSHDSRTYMRHGRQLVCYDHSDQIRRIDDLPGIVAAEARDAWGETDHAHVLIGHRHHLDVRSKDLRGVTVYQSRSTAPTTAYERGAGWVGTPRRLETWVLGARRGCVAHLSAG